MQPQGDDNSLKNPTGLHRGNFRELSKVVGALLLSAASAGFLVENIGGVVEVRNRLQCGQTIQEVRNDHYKEHPTIYYLLSPARAIGGSISQPSSHIDDRCFKNGEFIGLFPYTPAGKS